jgi:hypothetical protein
LLEKSGRKDHREGEALSARTVRYLHTTIHAVLAQAMKDQLLARNPADAATPPSAAEARPPEITCWTADQLAAFLNWSEANGASHALWHILANTGAPRRGPVPALPRPCRRPAGHPRAPVGRHGALRRGERRSRRGGHQEPASRAPSTWTRTQSP